MACFTLPRGSGDRSGCAARHAAGIASAASATSALRGTPDTSRGMTRARSGSSKLRLHVDTNTTQKVGRQHAARIHDHGVVLDGVHLPLALYGDSLAEDLSYVGIEQYPQNAGLLGGL